MTTFTLLQHDNMHSTAIISLQSTYVPNLW